MAFETLAKLRSALGVRSFLTRHVNKLSRGYVASSHARESYKRAEVTVKQWASVYRRNWDALVRLDPVPEALQGLQPLVPEDLVLLSTWLEEEKYRNKAAILPWIWAVFPPIEHGGDIEQRMKDWNEEGAPDLST